MKKRISALIATVLSTAMACSMVFTASATNGTHEAKISETKYRYYMASYDSAAFVKGKRVDDIKGLKSEYPGDNGPNKLYHATIEAYPHLGGSSNKAMKIASPNKETTIPQGKYTCFFVTPGKIHGTKKTILKPEQAIPMTANDHGYMFHVEMKALEGQPAGDGFCVVNDDKEKSVSKHVQRDLNVTMQERDYPNGKPVADPENEKLPITTALNTNTNNKLTYIWTKDANFEYSDSVKDANGADVKNDKGEVQYETKTFKRSKGDAEYYVTNPPGSNTNAVIKFPRDFCGYVMIPFSSFSQERGWTSKDTDGKINLMNLELVNFYIGLYQQQRGEIWIDDCAFYGPTFANVGGAFEVSFDPKNPAARTQKPIDLPPVTDAPQGDFPEPDAIIPTTSKASGDPAVSADASTAIDASTDVSIDDISGVLAETDTSKTSVVSGSGSEGPANLWWIWIVVGVVVIAGAGVGVFFYLKKRNGEGDDEFEQDDEFADEDTTDSTESFDDSSDNSQDDNNSDDKE